MAIPKSIQKEKKQKEGLKPWETTKREDLKEILQRLKGAEDMQIRAANALRGGFDKVNYIREEIAKRDIKNLKGRLFRFRNV